MQRDGYSNASANKQLMSNKQVIMVFALGIAMLLIAFWAGLSIIKGSIVASSTQATAKNANLPPQQKPVEPQKQNEAVAQNSDTSQNTVAESSAETRYTVRVATYGTLEKAEELKMELRKKNYFSAYVQMPSGADTLYYVNVGPFGKREDAQQVANELSIEKKVLGIFQDVNN
jgi:cell division septation protein DedD